MLTIRLSRTGRRNRPFFRVVLTEHTKPVKSGYKQVLWWYDPIKHNGEYNVEEIKKHIKNWAQMSSRAAKLVYNYSKDDIFKKFFTIKDIKRKPKKEEDSKE